MTFTREQANLRVSIRSVRESDRVAVERVLLNRWGPPGVVTRGTMHHAQSYPGFLAWSETKIVGLLTYRLHRNRCEIVTLDALRQGQGIGSRLLAALERRARRDGCREAWLITTNDNLRALRFYQRRGWRIRCVHPDALSVSRKIKPSIPRIGLHGIPIRDEIELYKPLVSNRRERT